MQTTANNLYWNETSWIRIVIVEYFQPVSILPKLNTPRVLNFIQFENIEIAYLLVKPNFVYNSYRLFTFLVIWWRIWVYLSSTLEPFNSNFRFKVICTLEWIHRKLVRLIDFFFIAAKPGRVKLNLKIRYSNRSSTPLKKRLNFKTRFDPPYYTYLLKTLYHNYHLIVYHLKPLI